MTREKKKKKKKKGEGRVCLKKNTKRIEIKASACGIIRTQSDRLAQWKHIATWNKP